MDDPQPYIPASLKPFNQQFLPEIWAIIISFLSDRSDIQSCSRVNHQLNYLTLPLIWARFTLHLNFYREFDLSDHLSTIVNNPEKARHITALRVLFLEPKLESDLTITPSTISSHSLAASFGDITSTIVSMIETIFSLVENVKDLTIVQVDRGIFETYYPKFSSDIAGVFYHEAKQASQLEKPFAGTVLRLLEDWSPTPKLCRLSTVNVSFETVVHFLQAKSSLSYLSFVPPKHNSVPPDSLQLPASLTLRCLRTSDHWAQSFLTSTSPTHSLVLYRTLPNGRSNIPDLRLGKLSTPMKILQAEEMALFQITLLLMSGNSTESFSNLQVIVHSARKSAGAPDYLKLGVQMFQSMFGSEQSIHTCVLRVTDIPYPGWTTTEAPHVFARDLTNRLAGLKGRSLPPRIIVEMGPLGTPRFVCWIFTMDSSACWTCQKEINIIQNMVDREDLLYLNRS
ncbi:hypothetical protein DL93DRAFT_351536 [Clavulina sp. PMI_390]|nr:hypothetical protein DL93DRAFT_351536 [Clavulina sp. PMI_390]